MFLTLFLIMTFTIIFIVGLLFLVIKLSGSTKDRRVFDNVCAQLTQSVGISKSSGRTNVYEIQQQHYTMTVSVTAPGKNTSLGMDIGVDAAHLPSDGIQGHPPWMASPQTLTVETLGEVVIATKTRLEKVGEVMGFSPGFVTGDEAFDNTFTIHTQAPPAVLKCIMGTIEQRHDIMALHNMGFKEISLFRDLTPIHVSCPTPTIELSTSTRLMEIQHHMTQIARRLPVFEPIQDKLKSSKPSAALFVISILTACLLFFVALFTNHIWTPILSTLFWCSMISVGILWVPYMLLSWFLLQDKPLGFQRFTTFQQAYLLVMPLLIYTTFITLNGTLPAETVKTPILIKRLWHTTYKGDKCGMEITASWHMGIPYKQPIPCATYTRLKRRQLERRQKLYKNPLKATAIVSSGGLGFKWIVDIE